MGYFTLDPADGKTKCHYDENGNNTIDTAYMLQTRLHVPVTIDDCVEIVPSRGIQVSRLNRTRFIAREGNVADAPLTQEDPLMCFLIDVSYSMAERLLGSAAQKLIAESLANATRPDGPNPKGVYVMVYTFSEQLKKMTEGPQFVKNEEVEKFAYKYDFRPEGSTYYKGALLRVLSEAGASGSKKISIFTMTDGDDNASTSAEKFAVAKNVEALRKCKCDGLDVVTFSFFGVDGIDLEKAVGDISTPQERNDIDSRNFEESMRAAVESESERCQAAQFVPPPPYGRRA